MSFKCQQCHVPQPSGTSPEVVIHERERDYLFPFDGDENVPGRQVRINDDGEIVLFTTGSEIYKERKLCRECAGVNPPPAPTEQARSYHAFGKGLAVKGSHAHTCKKALEECKSCQGAIAYMNGFSLNGVSIVCEEPMARTFKSMLGLVAADNLVSRASHKSKRASNEFKSVYPGLKKFEQRFIQAR